MKLAKSLLSILLAALLLMPTVLVRAESSKAGEVVALLNESETMKSLNGTATYEGDAIEIAYSTPSTSSESLSFPYEGSVIEYTPGEITSYDEANDASSHVYGAIQLIYAALEMNGYTQEQIRAFLSSSSVQPTFERNGFEFKEVGEAKEFASDDGLSTVMMTPMSVKLDVSKANLNGADDEAFTPTDATVEDLVDHLSADESFTTVTFEDGTLFTESSIYADDEYVIIDTVTYTYDYHNLYFDCVDDVLTYEAPEITDYDEASAVLDAEVWATILLQYALKANGCSDEAIAAFFASEEVNVDYEHNGIEIKELGDAQTFEGEWGDLTVTPVSIKIDFARANLDAAEAEPESEEETSEQGNSEADIENNGSKAVAPNGEADNAAESSEPVSSPATGDMTAVAAIALLLTAGATLTVLRKRERA